MQGQTSSYIITTLLVPPASNWLTSLADVKDELGISEDDPSQDKSLRRYISQESANIARHCNRIFGLAVWQDEFRPQRGIWGEGVRAALNPLTLTKWPLTAAVTSFTGNTHSTNAVDTLSSTAGLYAGQLIFGAGITNGTTILSVNATAESLVLSRPATTAGVGVPFNTGISVVETTTSTDIKTLVAGKDFEIDQGSLLPGDEGVGSLYRLNELGHPRTWRPTQIVVVYQAGYALPTSPMRNQIIAIPADIAGACTEIVVGRYRAKGRDPLLRTQDQPSLGHQEWWIGAAPGQNGPYPNEIMAVLDRYRVPVTAAA